MFVSITNNNLYLGSGCGSVVRAVRGSNPVIGKHSYLYWTFVYCQLCIEKTKIKKRGRVWPILKKNNNLYLFAERWSLLLTVVFLNTANCAHWISYGSVNSKCAIFYDRNADEITRDSCYKTFLAYLTVLTVEQKFMKDLQHAMNLCVLNLEQLDQLIN